MTEKFFVDTNVLIYFRDSSAGKKQQLAAAWIKLLWQNRAGRISTQVLNEFYYAATHKIKPGLSPASARKDVTDLFSWNPILMDRGTIATAWEIQDSYEISFWDSLIVAAAKLSD